MSCTFCFSIKAYQDVNGKHTCIPLTCSNCFSPKDLFDRLCRKCMTSPPCFFCQDPSAFSYQGVSVCPTHLSMSCQLEIDMRNQDRKEFNDNYEKVMLMQKLRREEYRAKHTKMKKVMINKKRKYIKKSKLKDIKEMLDRKLKHATFAI